MFHNYLHKSPIEQSQAGFAMIISLVMLLVLMAMGIAITHVANLQSNLVSAVTDKSLSIDAAETCFDNALEWLVTPAGQGWEKGLACP